jgi:hypothetical protein
MTDHGDEIARVIAQTNEVTGTAPSLRADDREHAGEPSTRADHARGAGEGEAAKRCGAPERRACAHCPTSIVLNPELGWIHESPVFSSIGTAPYLHHAVPATNDQRRATSDSIDLPSPGEVYKLAAERKDPGDLYLAVHCGREMISGSEEQYCRICGARVIGVIYKPFTPQKPEPSE